MEEEKDQVASDVAEEKNEGDQAEDEKSEEPKDELTLEKTVELVKGLQKGYTLSRQEISEMKDNLVAIAEKINEQKGVESGDEEYLTAGKLKEILTKQAQDQEQRKSQADKYIEDAVGFLKAEGKITSKEDEDALINYALEIKEPDLMKAATLWGREKAARKEGERDKAKAKAKQEEGSKVGTSSKTSEGESRGVDYSKVSTGQWW